MSKRKFFRVTVHETRALDYLIEAKSAAEARELVMLGSFDDPVSDEGLGVDIVAITESESESES